MKIVFIRCHNFEHNCMCAKLWPHNMAKKMKISKIKRGKSLLALR